MRGQKVGSSALQKPMPASRTQQRPRRRKANDEIAPNAPTPPGPPNMLLSLEKTRGPGQGAGMCGRQPPPLGRLFRRLGVYRQAN